MKNLLLFILLSLVQNCFSQNEMYFGQESPGKEAQIFAPGIISVNTRFDQQSTYTPDGAEFCFSVTNSAWNSSRIWYTKFENGEWSKPKAAPFINSQGCDPFFSPDGNYLFYLRFEDVGVLYRFENVDGEWKNATRLDSSITSEPSCSLSSTNNGTLYFCSDQPEANGGTGIYKSVLENGEYHSIEKVASPINDYVDTEPFIAPDESYLIFSSSKRPGGCGQDDLYISFNTETGWTEPINLGQDINSNELEFTPYVSPDNQYLFFTRRKAWGTTSPSNVYWADASFIDSLKSVVTTDVGQAHMPTDIHLFQNYPNPFNPKTTINYSIKNKSNVILTVINTTGQLVKTLVDGERLAGLYSATWDGEDEQNNRVSSGIYLYRLAIDNCIQCKKMVLMQ